LELKWKAHESDGIIYQTLIFPDGFWAKKVEGGSEALVYREVFKTKPLPVRLIGVWTFIGLDRGDIVEADTDVFCQKGIGLAHRSLHKENFSTYDAWKYYPLSLNMTVRKINFHVTCRVNGKNHHLDDRLSARVHFGLELIGEER